jgi:threonine/homoserine/homoserine lactone efflux protein
VIDLPTLVAFCGATLLLMLSPGPNMAFVLAHGASHGWRGGVAAAAGIAAADGVLTLACAAGVAGLIAGWPPALMGLRVAGGCYLLWLAFRAWTRPAAFVAMRASQASLRAIGVRAALNCLLNPKAVLFFVVFLPSFARADRGGYALQLMTLGVVFTLIAAGFHGALGVAGGAVSRATARWAPGAVYMSRALALLFAALGLQMLSTLW